MSGGKAIGGVEACNDLSTGSCLLNQFAEQRVQTHFLGKNLLEVVNVYTFLLHRVSVA